MDIRLMLKECFDGSEEEKQKIRKRIIGQIEPTYLDLSSRITHRVRKVEETLGINFRFGEHINVSKEEMEDTRKIITYQIENGGLKSYIRDIHDVRKMKCHLSLMIEDYSRIQGSIRVKVEVRKRILMLIREIEKRDFLLENYIRNIHYGRVMEMMLKRYFNVSKEEMEKIRKRIHMFRGEIATSDIMLESYIEDIDYGRTMEKQHGRHSLETQPLVHIMSLTVHPYPKKKEEDNKQQQQLALYGTIYAHYFDAYKTPVAHQIYKRGADVPDILGTDGSLTLNGPDLDCDRNSACFPLLQSSRISVNLFDQTNSVFARRSIFLDNNIDYNYEQVKSIEVLCHQGSLTLQYIVIPFGVHCLLSFLIPVTKGVEKNEIVNVNGTIVARYADTYGNYSSQECVLFKKQDTEFEPVENHFGFVKLSRCWLSAPAYSSLIIEVDLSEFGSGRKIANCTKKLLPRQGWTSGQSPFLDDIDILISETWFSPQPFGRNDYESSAADDGEPPIDDESSAVLSSSLNRCSWCLRSHKDKPMSSTAVEIFSVLIGQEKSKAVQIYGSIQVLRNDIELCYIFKRDENEALGLSENLNSIPISDGSRVFDYCSSLKMKFDIKDIEGCLAIKGYVVWAKAYNSGNWYDKQLCSLIQGQHGGFAAIHYSIFEEAVRVTIKVLLNLKTGSFDANPKVWGSLVTQYSHYDYSSRYNKDYYRSVLFNSTRDDPVQISNDLTIPLSRSTIIVPSYCSLIVNVDLSFGVLDQKLSCDKSCHEIKIGECCKTVDTNDYLLRIELDWCEVE